MISNSNSISRPLSNRSEIKKGVIKVCITCVV